MARGQGPFKIIEKVGDNAYTLQLPKDVAVSATFNISELSPMWRTTLKTLQISMQILFKKRRLMYGKKAPRTQTNSKIKDIKVIKSMPHKFRLYSPSLAQNMVLDSLLMGDSKGSYG